MISIKNNVLCKALALLLCIGLTIGLFVSCGQSGDPSVTTDDSSKQAQIEEKDYASIVKLDTTNGNTKKLKVTVKSYIDGDTTHFKVPTTEFPDGVLKARYLAINTPESTGKIEEWGKKASNFTKDKLSHASSIYVESDDGNWNADSTGSRYLVWVWYRNSENEDYRNLNLEILQNGLAIASSSANNRYGSYAMDAIAQAKALKLNLYSGEKDPDFFYGDAYEISLRELRVNIEDYNNSKVAFEGVITKNYNNGVYIEEYDAELDMYFGMYVYYGFNLSGTGLGILKVGNRARIVGTVSYYETGGSWQVSGLTYREMKPNDPGNIQKISENNSPAYRLTTIEQFCYGTVDVEVKDATKDHSYAALAIGSSISMENLEVTSIYTTDKADSSSNGAMTLTCVCNGKSITVRTSVLYDENKQLITADKYLGKKINVRGIIDVYDGSTQIRVFDQSDITILN